MKYINIYKKKVHIMPIGASDVDIARVSVTLVDCNEIDNICLA